MMQMIRRLLKHLVIWFTPRKTRPYEGLRVEMDCAEDADSCIDNPVIPFLKEPEAAEERQCRSSSRRIHTE